MATVNDTIDSIVVAARRAADGYMEKADAAVDGALTTAQGFVTGAVALTPFTPVAVEPPTPYIADATLTYEANRLVLITAMSAQLADFYVNYYPLTADAFDEATTWLVDTIGIGGTGIQPGIEDQIWQRGRTRILIEGKRAESQVMTGFAARGFALPPGALTGALKEVQFEQLAKNSEASSSVAIKQAELEVENIRFAVEQAIKSRLAAMSAATDYIRALMSAPDAAARIAMLNTDARAKMMSATTDLYRARLSRDELVLRSQNADQDTLNDQNKWSAADFRTGAKVRVDAAMAAADVYGKSAQAALSSLNTVASASQLLFE